MQASLGVVTGVSVVEQASGFDKKVLTARCFARCGRRGLLSFASRSGPVVAVAMRLLAWWYTVCNTPCGRTNREGSHQAVKTDW